jgi:hypothetical protein
MTPEATTPRARARRARARARQIAPVALSTVSLLALALWAGGLVALGAFAAPAVFGNVPAPWSGDAMTIAFRRFDSFAIGCALVALVCEAGLAMVRRPVERVDLARGASLAAMTVLALGQALVLSPRIASLHAAGAIRGFGEAGRELDIVHDRAKMAGQIVLLLALVVVVLHVARLARGAAPPAPADAGATARTSADPEPDP